MRITFDITVEEANLILNALAKLPYEKVGELFPRLKNSAQNQVNEQAGAPIDNNTKWRTDTT